MKKVLIAGEYPASGNRRRGGIETVTWNTAESLSRRTDLDVHVLCIREGLAKARVRRVGEVTVHESPGLSLPHSLTMYTWDYFVLRRAIKRIKPDFIHAQSQDRYALAAIKSGLPMVMSIHGLFFKQSELLEGSAVTRRIRKFLWNRIERFCISRAPAVIVMNDYVGSVAREFAGGAVHFVHNPISDDYFIEPATRKKKKSGGKTVLFAGMISKRKYLEKLLEVAALVVERDPEVRFRVAGKAQDDQYYRDIVRLSKKLGIAGSVDFLGFIPEEDLLEEYRRADLFILTSREDTSPMAVAQAMAAGLPVVASRIGGIPELVEDGVTGFLGDNEHPEGMARSVLEILDNPRLRSHLGRMAAEKASGLFTEKAVAGRLQEIYRAEGTARAENAGTFPGSVEEIPKKIITGSDIADRSDIPEDDGQLKRTRILIVGPVSPPFGGVESVVETLLGSDLARNYRLYHLSTRKKLVRSAAKGRFGFSNLFYGIYHIFKLLYYVAWVRPALAHMPVTSNLPGFTRDAVFIRICGLFRCPVTGHLHGGSFDKFLHEASPLKRRFILRSLAGLHTLIVLSRYWKDLLEPDLPDTRITIVHNAVGPEWLLADKGRTSDSITVLFVGSLGKRKGVFEILKAAEILGRDRDDIFFRIVGTEERLGEMNQLETLFDNLGLNGRQVSFPGALYGEDKKNAYRDADIFILPAYNEAFPIVILEAFGSGLPVISCPVGSIPEVIRDGENGFLVEPGDYRALADRIGKLADDRTMRRRMGKKNREILEENYVSRKMVERIDSVYRAILGLSDRKETAQTGRSVSTW